MLLEVVMVMAAMYSVKTSFLTTQKAFVLHNDFEPCWLREVLAFLWGEDHVEAIAFLLDFIFGYRSREIDNLMSRQYHPHYSTMQQRAHASSFFR